MDTDPERAQKYADWLRSEESPGEDIGLIRGYDITAVVGDEVSEEEVSEYIEEGVDVVLVDEGVEVYEFLRSSDVRIVVLADVDSELKTEDEDTGSDKTIRKPLERKELVEAVEGFFYQDIYHEQVEEYFDKVARKAMFEAMSEDMGSNSEYAEVSAKAEALRNEIDDVVSEFDESDFETAFYDLEDMDG